MGRKVVGAEERVGSISADCAGNTIRVLEYKKYKEVLVGWDTGESVWTTWRHFNEGILRRPEVRLGSFHKCTADEVIEVIEYPNSHQVVVRWEDGSEKTATWREVVNGWVKKPFESRIGRKFTNSIGESYEVVDWRNNREVDVLWEATGNISTHQWSHVVRSNVRNPIKVTSYGVGIASTRFPEDSDVYNAWNRMITRTHNKEFLERQQTYADVEVSPELLIYEKFYNVYTNLCGYGVEGFALDKDILSRYYGRAKPIYSESTICLVPRRLNSLVIDRDEDAGVIKSEFGTFYVSYRGKYRGSFPTLELARDAYVRHRTEDLQSLVYEYRDVLDPRAIQALEAWEF